MEETDTQTDWHDEITTLKQSTALRSNQKDLITFYGSSSLRLWTTMYEDLYPLNTINLGFGGSTYEDCLYYFSEVFEPLQPCSIVLYGGDNDLSIGKTSAMIIADFKNLVQRIYTRFPTTGLAVISIKPSPARAPQLSEIRKTNDFLRAYVEQLGGTYIDIHTAMLDNEEKPKQELFVADELHLNDAGYALWTSIIKQHLMGQQA